MGQDYKTMRVPTDAWERAKEQKEANDRTWGEQIVRPDDGVDTDSTTTNDIVEQMLQSLETVEERTGRIERLLEDIQR